MNLPGEAYFVERRLVDRVIDLVSKVKVIGGKESRVCEIYNVSMGGLCLRHVDMGLTRGMRVELRFMIPHLNGTTKIHLRHATIVYMKDGLTGFAIDTVPYHA